jgi:hypothetical protein
VIAFAAALVALCVSGDGIPRALADHTCRGLTSTIHGTEGPDVIVGTNGDDVIHGLGDSDEIDGLAGNDVICGGGGFDYLTGGPGDDTLDGGVEGAEASYAGAPGPVTANLATGTATGEGTDTLIDIGSVSGSSFGDSLTASDAGGHLLGNGGPDILTGGTGRDTLVGGEGNDQLHAGDGRDVLEGDAGSALANDPAGDDILDGGDGADTLDYSFTPGPVAVDLVTSTVTGLGTDTLTSIDIVIGSGGNDMLMGDAGDNIFDGALGDDVIDGGGGNDTVQFLTFTGGGIAANLASGTATGMGADTLTAIENLTGSYGNDSFIGGDGANVLIGGEGNDSLAGGAGSDTLIGGFHTDSLNGGDDTDICDPEPGADTLQACETVPAAAAQFEGTLTSCGDPCVELLMTIVNDTGAPVGEAIIGNASAGTTVTPGMAPPAGWQELGGKGSVGACFTEGSTFHGATSGAFAVQPGASLPHSSYQMTADPGCASHTNLWYWQVATLDGAFIEDGALRIDDTDGDGYFDGFDNCVGVANPTQLDGDGDQAGDACEAAGSGNVDCGPSPNGVNAIDALKLLRHSASLPVTQSEPCADIGAIIGGGHIQGDIDCSTAVNSIDALKILRAVAGLGVAQLVGCPDIQ